MARDILQKPNWTPSKLEPEAPFCMRPLQNSKNEHCFEGITFKVRCGRHTSDESLRFSFSFSEFPVECPYFDLKFVCDGILGGWVFCATLLRVAR